MLRIARAPAMLLFVFFACFYGLCNAGHTGSPDEEQLILQTQSLLHGRFTIAIPADAKGVVSARALSNGDRVPIRGLGQSIVAAPFYVAGRVLSAPVGGAQREAVFRFILLFTNVFVTAGTVTLLYLLSRELAASVRGALIVAFAYGLGTLAWPHATNFFTEPLSAFVVTAAFTLLIAGLNRRRLELIAFAGLVAGAAPLSRASNAMFVGVFALAAWIEVFGRVRRFRKSLGIPIVFVVASLPTLGFWLLTNYLRYGSPTDFGYQASKLSTNVGTALRAYAVGPSRSLLLYAPIVVLALCCLPIAFRRRPSVPTAAILATIANALIFAGFKDWWGGQAWGPRYLDITLPLLVALTAFVIDRIRWRIAAFALIAAGIAINFLGVAIFYNAYYSYADGKLTQAGNPPHAYIVKTRDEWHWAPLEGHARLLRRALENTWDRIDGHDRSITTFPGATNKRFFWYDHPVQLNVWWAWWRPMRAPPAFLLLVPLFLLGAVTSAVGLWYVTRPGRGRQSDDERASDLHTTSDVVDVDDKLTTPDASPAAVTP